MSLTTLLFVLLALYLLSAVLIRRFALRGLMCSRAFARSAVFEGEESEMIEIVRNDRPFTIPWLRVESGISPYIRLGRQENLSVSECTHTCSLFTLMPYQQIRRRHRVKFLRRGEYNLGSASLTTGDLFGLIEAHREQDMSVPVLVYPRLLDESELPAPLLRLMSAMISQRSLLSDPFLVRGIRPYQAGDPVRDIHWPASARTGELHIRLHDPSSHSRLLVVLNAQRTANQWGDKLAQEEEAGIEHEISIAATMMMNALSAGHSAGFCANMPIGESRESAFLAPAGDAAAKERILSALARLRLTRTLRIETYLEQLCEQADPSMPMDIILLSCYDSEEIQTALAALRRRGHQAELFLTKGGAQA